MNRLQVIDYLRELTDKQFVELFYEATTDRRTDPLAKGFEEARWVLTEGSRVLADDSESWEPWTVTLIALHDPEEYDGGWHDDSPLCQE